MLGAELQPTITAVEHTSSLLISSNAGCLTTLTQTFYILSEKALMHGSAQSSPPQTRCYKLMFMCALEHSAATAPGY